MWKSSSEWISVYVKPKINEREEVDVKYLITNDADYVTRKWRGILREKLVIRYKVGHTPVTEIP